MTYYGAKHLADSFRTVRKNTLAIAEEIPEDKYGFKATPGRDERRRDARAPCGRPDVADRRARPEDGTARLRVLRHAHAAGEGRGAGPPLKAEIIGALTANGDGFAQFLEGLDEATLQSSVAPLPAAEQDAVRDAPRPEGARDAPPRAADAGAAADRPGAALTRRRQEMRARSRPRRRRRLERLCLVCSELAVSNTWLRTTRTRGHSKAHRWPLAAPAGQLQSDGPRLPSLSQRRRRHRRVSVPRRLFVGVRELDQRRLAPRAAEERHARGQRLRAYSPSAR